MRSKESWLVTLQKGRGGRWSDRLRFARLPFMVASASPSQLDTRRTSFRTSLRVCGLRAKVPAVLQHKPWEFVLPPSLSHLLFLLFPAESPISLKERRGLGEATRCLRTDRKLSGLLHATCPRSLVGACVARILCYSPSFTS